jgi:deoxyribonuclease-1
MNYKHDVVISEDEYIMFLKWSINDPPYEWEFTKNARIKKLQGNFSVFVDMFIK